MPDIPLNTEDARVRLIQYIKALDLARPWVVTVKRQTKQRSLSANNLYWKWMTEAGNALGYDKADMDDVMKEVCDCPAKTIMLDGVAHERRTTSGLTGKEMGEYMDRCYRKLVGEMGLYLTIPEEGMAA